MSLTSRDTRGYVEDAEIIQRWEKVSKTGADSSEVEIKRTKKNAVYCVFLKRFYLRVFNFVKSHSDLSLFILFVLSVILEKVLVKERSHSD